MAEERYERIAMLRYMEQQESQLLRQVVANSQLPDKETYADICRAFNDHDRHYLELDAVLRDAGQRAVVPSRIQQREFDDRLKAVGQASDPVDLVSRLARLERFSAEEYSAAIRNAEEPLRHVLQNEMAEERQHVRALEAAARGRKGR